MTDIDALDCAISVRRTDDGYFEFLSDGEMVYDIQPRDVGEALRWVEHLALKSWVTKRHLHEFASLVAAQFGVGHR